MYEALTFLSLAFLVGAAVTVCVVRSGIHHTRQGDGTAWVEIHVDLDGFIAGLTTIGEAARSSHLTLNDVVEAVRNVSAAARLRIVLNDDADQPAAYLFDEEALRIPQGPITINQFTLTTPGNNHTDTPDSTAALAVASNRWEALRNHRFDAAMRGIMVFRPGMLRGTGRVHS